MRSYPEYFSSSTKQLSDNEKYIQVDAATFISMDTLKPRVVMTDGTSDNKFGIIIPLRFQCS